LLIKYFDLAVIIIGGMLGALFCPLFSNAQEHGLKVAAEGQISQEAAEKPRAGGSVREKRKDGLRYVWIPRGTFTMGCSSGDGQCDAGERPAHQVTITKGFWMGRTEITVAAYKRFVAATGKRMPTSPVLSGRELNPDWDDEAMPMVDVTWFEARSYCGWAGGRLPTEAEWEYAARAGSSLARYGNLDEIAWYAENSGNQRLDSSTAANEGQVSYLKRLNQNGNDMHHLGLKRANGFGLYDMLGNVWEWVNDWYDPNYYESSPSQDPGGPEREQMRVMRGGSWSDFPWHVRVSGRSGVFAAYLDNNLGFRCASDGEFAR